MQQILLWPSHVFYSRRSSSTPKRIENWNISLFIVKLLLVIWKSLLCLTEFIYVELVGCSVTVGTRRLATEFKWVTSTVVLPRLFLPLMTADFNMRKLYEVCSCISCSLNAKEKTLLFRTGEERTLRLHASLPATRWPRHACSRPDLVSAERVVHAFFVPYKNAGLRFPLSLWSCVRFSICLGMIFDT